MGASAALFAMVSIPVVLFWARVVEDTCHGYIVRHRRMTGLRSSLRELGAIKQDEERGSEKGATLEGRRLVSASASRSRWRK
jgi:hypothetical protein